MELVKSLSYDWFIICDFLLLSLQFSFLQKKIDESDTTPSETPADSDEITGNDTDSSEAVSSEEDEEKKSINKNLVNAEKCSGKGNRVK